jgi:hypothetical protein
MRTRSPLTLFIIALAWVLQSCASGQHAQPPSPAPPPSAAERGAQNEESSEAIDSSPATFADLAKRFEFTCPTPPFALEKVHNIQVGPATYRIEGSRIVRSPGLKEKLRLGIVASPKDATEETRQNLRVAQGIFQKAGVHAVVVPGDLAEDNELRSVMQMLAETFPQPLLIHSGNIEWPGTFNVAYEAVRKDHPHLFNLNWAHHVDFGGVHLLVLPGYHNKTFSRSGACAYGDEHLSHLETIARQLRGQGDQVILTSHGPPQNEGAGGLDVAYDDAGNVGDPAITQRLLEGADIRFGIFSHILEAGGRAVFDPWGKTPAVALKKRKQAESPPGERLYLNAGSASALPWTMLDGSASEGMAALFDLEGDKARVTFFSLRAQP